MGQGKKLEQRFIDDNKDKVMKMAQLGCTDWEISRVIGVGDYSLKTIFRESLDLGRGDLRISLRKAQIELAIRDKNPTMLIWLGKNYLSQREPHKVTPESEALVIEKVVYSEDSKGNISNVQFIEAPKQLEIKTDGEEITVT